LEVVLKKLPVRVGAETVHYHLMLTWFELALEEMWEKGRLHQKSHRLVRDVGGMQSIHLVGRRSLPGMLAG
jgi:hypothetical protein